MKKLTLGIMTLVMGASLSAAGPNFVDKNNDKVCDTYVSRGNKTAYEAGVDGAKQYQNTESKMGQGNKDGEHKFRKEALGEGKNR